MNDHHERQADAVFKALSDRCRRLPLDTLRGRNGQTLTELCAGLLMARQSVGKHLAVLEAARWCCRPTSALLHLACDNAGVEQLAQR